MAVGSEVPRLIPTEKLSPKCLDTSCDNDNWCTLEIEGGITGGLIGAREEGVRGPASEVGQEWNEEPDAMMTALGDLFRDEPTLENQYLGPGRLKAQLLSTSGSCTSASSLGRWRPLNVRTCDICRLELQGCLRLPTKPIVDEFLRRYFLHVHPMLPLLNEGDFWDMYCGEAGGENKHFSLLLFQSILFASCSVRSRACSPRSLDRPMTNNQSSLCLWKPRTTWVSKAYGQQKLVST